MVENFIGSYFPNLGVTLIDAALMSGVLVNFFNQIS